MGKITEVFAKIREFEEEQKRANNKQSAVSLGYSPNGGRTPKKQFRVSGTSLMKRQEAPKTSEGDYITFKNVKQSYQV